MKTCPKCKSNMVIDIVYGYPSEEMSDAADSNKISLGGCCIDSSNPIFKCKSCFYEFGGEDEPSNDDLQLLKKEEEKNQGGMWRISTMLAVTANIINERYEMTPEEARKADLDDKYNEALRWAKQRKSKNLGDQVYVEGKDKSEGWNCIKYPFISAFK